MSKQVQLRRGTTAEHAVFTGANGEVTVDTDKKVLVVHDATTPGGYPLASAAALGDVNERLSDVESYIDTLNSYGGVAHFITWDTVNAAAVRGGASAHITTTTTNFGHFGSVNPNYDNPFDEIAPWSERKLCNVDIATYRAIYAAGGNLLDCVVAWEGDPDFKLDGSNGFVGVYTPEFWGLAKILPDGKWLIGVSPVALPGWVHFEQTIGGRWFGVADSTGITSKPGLAVVNETMAAIHARATAYDMTLDDIYTWSADTVLLCVEYATLNTQNAIGNGADAVYVQGVRPYINETGVTRVVMTDAQSANFRAGVMIDIGTTDGGYNTARRIVTSVEEYPSDTAYAIVNFDGAAVDITTALYVSAHGVANTEDAGILSTSGYIGANTKANAYYRGRVAHANYWRYCLGAYRQTGDGGVWIAHDRDEAAAHDALNTSVHHDTGEALPTTSDYISALHLLPDAPLAPVASATLGNSANPVGDYCYVPTLATANTVLLVGGDANDGVESGRFCGSWHNASSNSHWDVSGLPFLKTP